MPNITDDYIITVLTFFPSSLAAQNAEVDGGEDAAIPFVYRTGYPFATAFGIEWFSDTGRTTAKSGLSNVRFIPGAPVVPLVPDNTLLNGNLLVSTAASDTRTADDVFYGRMTIFQRNFNRETGQVV